MDKSLLLDAVQNLDSSGGVGSNFALPQAVRQFNALLRQVKSLYSTRPDIIAIDSYQNETMVYANEFVDVVRRFRTALELRKPGSVSELVASIAFPPDAPEDLASDLQELQEAVGLGLRKTALLLAGSIAEALLLLRHPDKSDRGPGLHDLLIEARDQRLFGRDTIRQLETLNDYRDLIHTRAGPRNRIVLNDGRMEHAVMALKLLCSELQDSDVRYNR